MFWWMDVAVNWSTFCQECRRAVFWPLVVPSVHLGTFSIPENNLIGYSDDSTLVAVMPLPGARVMVAES